MIPPETFAKIAALVPDPAPPQTMGDPEGDDITKPAKKKKPQKKKKKKN